MISADDYTDQIQDQIRRDVTDDYNIAVANAASYLVDAVDDLLTTAGHPGLANHLWSAEIVDAILDSLPWDDIAAERADAEGLIPFTDPADGLTQYRRAAA